MKNTTMLEKYLDNMQVIIIAVTTNLKKSYIDIKKYPLKISNPLTFSFK